MARYIDADNLLEKLYRMIDYCEKDRKVNAVSALFQAGDAIMDCKTADVQEVRHGKWLPNMEWFDDDYGIESHEERYPNGWKCSLCGRFEHIKEPYCNCGAKMDVEE